MECESCKGEQGKRCLLCNGTGHVCDKCGEPAEDSGGMCMDCIDEELNNQ
jgi:hypothetical protein